MDGEWTLIEYRPGRYAKVSPDGSFLEMATEEETRAWFAARMRLDRSPPLPRSEPVRKTAEGSSATPQLEASPVRAEAPPPEFDPEPLQDEVDLLEPQAEPPYESPDLDAIDRLLREAEAALSEPRLVPAQATMPARHLAPTGEPLELDSVTERPVRTTPVSPPSFLEPEPTASSPEPEPESLPDKAGPTAMEAETLALPLGLEVTAEIEAQPEPETLPLPLELGSAEELEEEPEPTAPTPRAEAVSEPMEGEDELAVERDLAATPGLLLDEDEQEVEEAFEADSELQADEDRLEAEQDLGLDTEPLADEDELEDEEDFNLDAELLLDEDELEEEEDSELDLELLLDEDEPEDEEDFDLDAELLLDEDELEEEEDSELLYRPSGRGVHSASGIKGKPSPTEPLTFDEEEDLALDLGPEDRWLWVDPRTESGYDPLTFDQKAFLQRAVALYQAKSWSRGHSPGRLMIHPALLANGVVEIAEVLGMTVLTDPAVTPGTYRLGRAEEQNGQPTSS